MGFKQLYKPETSSDASLLPTYHVGISKRLLEVIGFQMSSKENSKEGEVEAVFLLISFNKI